MKIDSVAQLDHNDKDTTAQLTALIAPLKSRDLTEKAWLYSCSKPVVRGQASNIGARLLEAPDRRHELVRISVSLEVGTQAQQCSW